MSFRVHSFKKLKLVIIFSTACKIKFSCRFSAEKINSYKIVADKFKSWKMLEGVLQELGAFIKKTMLEKNFSWEFCRKYFSKYFLFPNFFRRHHSSCFQKGDYSPITSSNRSNLLWEERGRHFFWSCFLSHLIKLFQPRPHGWFKEASWLK